MSCSDPFTYAVYSTVLAATRPGRAGNHSHMRMSDRGQQPQVLQVIALSQPSQAGNRQPRVEDTGYRLCFHGSWELLMLACAAEYAGRDGGGSLEVPHL